jgi:tetratricopeptide (TPR) repeat protein
MTRAMAAKILRAARNASETDRDELTALAVAVRPDGRAVLRLRVRSLLSDGDFEHAHALVARGLLIYPNDIAMMQCRASALDGLGRRDEALEEISRLLRIRPQRVGALVLGGQIVMAAGQFERAVMWLTRAHLCRPMCEEIKRQLAEALVRSRQGDAALRVINSLPRPLPLLRAQALRSLGRLHDAAEVLQMAIGSYHEGRTCPQPFDTTWDELLAGALIVAEQRGDVDEIDRLASQLGLYTPRAILQAARIDLSRGEFRRAMWRAARWRSNRRELGVESLAIIVAAAGMMQRNRLATRALRRMRIRFGRTDTQIMHECWRRAMLGKIIVDQRDPRQACADPSSSLLQPLLSQAARTLERRLRRHSAAAPPLDADEIRRQHQLCRDAMMLRSRQTATVSPKL